MARLLVGAEWYESLASSAQYEFEYEDLLFRYGEILFPSWTIVPFKMDVESETGRNRPDLALIDHSYRNWCVVEVELAHHSLDGHVLPQVRTFATGRYTSEHATNLQRREPTLDLSKLNDMIRGEQPQVLVVVDRPKMDWAKPLARLGARLMIVEVFRSNLNRHCLRVNGEHPIEATAAVTALKRHPLLPRTMLVLSPASLGGGPGAKYTVELDGSVTTWIRVETFNEVMLRPLKGDPLADCSTCQIVELSDGRLEFREIIRGR